MQVQSAEFKQRSSEALQDESLKSALGNVIKSGFVAQRASAISLVPQWQAIRDDAKALKDHVLANLSDYLLMYEKQVQENGGTVHWASDAADAQRIVLDICKSADARLIAKGKSMVSEEAGINEALEAQGLDVIETDLGEYIIQLAEEPPSHIIAPAIHKTKEQVSDLFHEHHQQYGLNERIENRGELVAEARQVLREKFLTADVGITGANFLIAETGQHILVTNEGNGDLTSNLPRVHVVLAGIEKVVPTLEDAACMLRLLARSATGQHFSNYTSLMSGPKREGERDGAEEFHVVLLDNQRSAMLDSALRDMLRCIRCGACMNHCPVYGAVGGHSYGWVYPGPMGSVLTPAIVGLEETSDLPHACTLNGRCAEVCPMSIPLPTLLRRHRQEMFERHLGGRLARYGISVWANIAKRPRIYHPLMSIIVASLNILSGKRRSFRRLPLASGWTDSRDMPAPSRRTFMQQYKVQQSKKS